ncbi:conserved protein of unknown function [Nitrospira japonica]|uniref:Uncharacterized protein n=1 Tax=Nitrospira japonica TaxID=1325564 RepID=A0A1W1I346_9BACT|nr:hypothetical protein [Nitrospira japonica]SLM47428.1 conserved protein of unknown function [Nitrospira japonica]
MPDPKLIDADHPLALFPVRLETRFFGTELRIRVYPDDIHIDTHEPELTTEELLWGKHFHELVWRAGGNMERTTVAWAQLADRFGAERAAYVALQLTPVNQGDRPSIELSPAQPFTAPPQFPSVASRPAGEGQDTWTRAPRTSVLPDRWLATAFVSLKPPVTGTGLPIKDPLPVGPNPQAQIPENPEQIPVDEDMRWMIEFDEAEKVGMALRLRFPPPAPGSSLLINRLIVYGVKASLTPESGALRVRELLTAHQFTEGLSILAQGTRTNNTDDIQSEFSSGKTTSEKIVRTVVGEPLYQTSQQCDGVALCRALGFPLDALTRIVGADNKEQLCAQHMNRAMWPATWGYYLDQMLNGLFPEAEMDKILSWSRSHFIGFVRASGPLPAVRVGRQPYGFLPVTSLEMWKPVPGEGDQPNIEAEVINFLRRHRSGWLSASGFAPHIRQSADPDEDFLRIFSMDGLSSRYVVRNVLGELYAKDLLLFMGMLSRETSPPTDSTFNKWTNTHVAMAAASLLQAGLRTPFMPGPFPPLSLALHDTDAHRIDALPIVQPHGQEAAIASLLKQDFSTLLKISPPYSLLQLLLRHALLLELSAAATRKLGVRSPSQRKEPEYIELNQSTKVETPVGRIRRAWPTIDNLRLPAASFLDDANRDFEKSLRLLAGLHTEQLDVLFRGTLDLSSHRLDAWITSFATRRLRTMRTQKPTGVYVGAYGWVENLQATAPLPRVSPPPGETEPLSQVAENPGFIHAPSLDQAATAAVLRSGQLSRALLEKKDLLAINLSSERARLAQWLLDGVRAGQPLGALLGYRLERGLHDHSLDRFIHRLRKLDPLAAVRVTEAEGESDGSSESIRASHVVDGLKLYRRWIEDGEEFRKQVRNIDAGGDTSLPPSPTELAALESELRSLGNVIDAVSDALLAESVHQIVRGNPTRAAATLDALERGEAPPPELEVLRTPRSGSGLTHRLCVIGSPSKTLLDWPDANTPRAQAEPWLNAWIAKLLGNPRNVRCRIEEVDPSTGAFLSLVDWRLSELPMSPLDIVYTSASTEGAQQSDLEQRILYAVRRSLPHLPSESELRFNQQRDPAWPLTDLCWLEFTEQVRAVRHLIMGVRPLDAADLTLGHLQRGEGIGLEDLRQRADRAAMLFRDALSAMQKTLAVPETAPLERLREEMLTLAAFGLPGGVPLAASAESDAARQVLISQGVSIEKEAAARLVKIDRNDKALNATGLSDEARLERYLERLKLVFGEDFVICPRVIVPDLAALETALAASTDLQGGDPFAVVTFHQRLARVREPIARLDEALRNAEALGAGDSLTLRVAQLPYQPGDRWIGLPKSDDKPLATGRLSLIAHLVGEIQLTEPLAGLMIDEWVEVVPNERETTGIVFQYDRPDACAPQAVLLAVPPNPAEQNFWTSTSLLQVLQESLDLAHIRAVTPDLLDQGQYLPALYFALNSKNDTISTNFLNPGNNVMPSPQGEHRDFDVDGP